ncbi:unnamed protein product, partial [Brassica oleracea]
PVIGTNTTSLLEPMFPLSEPVAPLSPLTSEAVTVPVCDSPSKYLASVNTDNAGDDSSSKLALPVTFGSHNPSENLAQAKEKFIPSMGSWAKPLYFKPPATPPDPSTPRDYDPAVVGNQLATLWPTLNDEILNKQPKGNMGEAKVLVEMELDRDFPKLIALDDKQGNIFLVNVEYTWVPSMCERCGNLGHKEKRCLLPSSTAQVSISASTSQDTSSDVPIVNIDTVMQQKDNVEYSTPTIQKNDLHVNEKASLPTEDYGAHEPEKRTIEIEGLLSELEATPTFQQENPTASPNFIPTLPTLVDSLSTPTTASIMESSPSTVINTEVSETLVVGPLATTHTPFAFESPAQFKGSRDVGLDEDGTEPSSSLSLTRGGRETKPPSKYQDMEWKTVRGRGKRGLSLQCWLF